MFLYNIRQNSKQKCMSIVNIVITCFMFVIINDKGVFNSIVNNFNSMGQSFVNATTTCPIENMLTGMINISRLIVFEYSFTMGIGFVFVELAFILALSFAIFTLIRKTTSFERLNGTKQKINLPSKVLGTNDIYLKTNKLIC